ncbi:kinase-like domain-containing protein [Hypoxylon sp. FL0890]|nr:kinase-like domain-containing protein [Hypoxylon sp. FL0890]
MIKEDWRYWAPSGALTPGGPSKWDVLDWDQRRLISVTVDEVLEDDEIAIGHLKRHIDRLEPGVYAIHVSMNGDLLSTSTDPEDDPFLCPYQPPLDEIQRPDWVKTVLRSELLELDRIMPNIDVVSYMPCPEASTPKKVAFKYYFLLQFINRRWDEMNLWIRLPPHPNIVPFDRIVLDEVDGNFVGFTTLYIPGGTIEENTSRVFKLKWLKQLTQVVDDLNFKYGIVHQDIAPRNLLVDPETDALMVFDFGYSGRIGEYYDAKNRDDVKGVIFTLYEIITRDDHFRSIPFDKQDPADVEGMAEWAKHPDVKLDHPVSEYRSVLNEWLKRRREGKQISIYTEAPEYIYWPEMKDPPTQEMIVPANQFVPTPQTHKWVPWTQRRVEKPKDRIVYWERPPQSKLEPGTLVFADGKVKAKNSEPE